MLSGMRRLKQHVNIVIERIVALISQKCFSLLGRRRKSRDIQRRTSQ